MHVVALAPGAESRVLLPTHRMLRVHSPRGTITSDEIQVWVSNGSGIFQLLEPAVDETGRSLIVSPDLSHPAVVSIRRPSNAPCVREVAIFISRTEYPTVSDPHGSSVLKGCDRVHLVRERDKRVLEQEAISASTWYKLEKIPCNQLVIETRLRYPRAEMRRQQSYQVLLRYEGQPARVIDFETTSEMRARYTIDGCDVVLGRPQIEYVCIPRGVSEVEVSSTADLLISVKPCSTCRCGNSPTAARAPCSPACIAQGFPWPDKRSLWNLREDEIVAAVQGHQRGCFPHAVLRRIARDNGHRFGGLSSVMLARAQVARWSGHPVWRQLAQDLEGMHTGFRHVLPSEKGPNRTQFFAWFHARRPRSPGESTSDHVVARQHVDDLLGRYLAGGFFSAVPSGRATPLVFHVPREDRPSRLRLAFDRRRQQKPVTVLLQLDDREPIQLHVACSADLPPDAYEPTLGETGLAALHRMHGSVDIGTLGGPFAQRHTPSVFISAGTMELLVPRETSVVRVWAAEATHLRVALQYRTSNVFQLSERAYLNLSWRQQMGSRSYWENMTGSNTAENASFALRELQNHWRPLVRFLRAQERSFLVSVEDPDRDRSGERLPSPGVGKWIQSARESSQQQQWLAAAEQWSRVMAQGSDLQRREAASGQLEALAELGEHVLAERTARGLYLYENDPVVSGTAYRFLYQSYLQQEDFQSLEVLTATAALREGTTVRLLELARALFQNERFDFALLVASSLPEDQQPRELMVRCAYQLRWWSVFQSEVEQLPSFPQRNFWKAHRLVHQGAYRQAVKMLRKAGPPGHRFAEHLEGGFPILQGLRSQQVAARAEAVLQWETWLAEFPGERVWFEDHSLVRASSGASLVYSVDRDLLSRFHHALPNEPLVLVVHGPARLRLTARPRHVATSDQPIDDWLNVRTAGQHQVYPITANVKTSSLRILGAEHCVPGRAVTATLSLGRGRHEVRVHADGTELLVQTHVERPELPLPILPTLNEETVGTALAGQWSTRIDSSLFAEKTLAYVVSPHGEGVAQPFVHTVGRSCWDADRMLSHVRSDLAARMAMRSAGQMDWYRPAIAELAESHPALDPHERLLAVVQAGVLDRADALLLDGPHLLPVEMRDAYLMATGRRPLSETLAHPDGEKADVLRRTSLLAYESERNVRQHYELAVLGKGIQLHRPDIPELQALSTRLSSSLRWQLLDRFDRSAGISKNVLPAWTPESPSLRVRRALMRNLSPHDHVLFGEDALVLTSRDVRPTVLEVSLEQLAVGYGPRRLLVVQYEVDGNPGGSVQIAATFGGRLSIELEPGTHSVGWRIVNPKLGQMVRLSVRTRAADSDLMETFAPERERLYHLATPQSPLEFSVQGPALLRVEELRDGHSSSRFLDVHEGSKRIRLVPSDGAERAMFRVFQTVHDPDRRRGFPLRIAAAPQPVEPPLVGSIDLPARHASPGDVQLAAFEEADDVDLLPLVPHDSRPVTVAHLDQRLLGGQEDGTWDVGVGWFHRRALEESPAQSGVDEFLQLSAGHRILHELSDRYRRNQAVLRLREYGGPTVGFLHQGWWDLPDSAWSLRWSSAAYTQRPDPRDPGVDREQEWSIDGRLRLSRRLDLAPWGYHLPSITTFARETSLDENPYGLGRVDQDVFTQYKRDHPIGLILTDRFVWEPCEERRWWASPVLGTNEDFNLASPDYVGVRTGIQQMMGGLDLDLSYRYTSFLADQDRARDADQHLLLADVHWHWWTFAGRRWEVATKVRHDLDGGGTSGSVLVSGYLDRGRQYRDFHPGELRFMRLRRQLAERATRP